jgi:hypothetical protein
MTLVNYATMKSAKYRWHIVDYDGQLAVNALCGVLLGTQHHNEWEPYDIYPYGTRPVGKREKRPLNLSAEGMCNKCAAKAVN